MTSREIAEDNAGTALLVRRQTLWLSAEAGARLYGRPSRIGTVLEVDDEQAAIVREIFARFVDGASCLAISRELNARGVPSP